MKMYLGVRNVVLLGCSTLLLGCQETEATSELEPQIKCQIPNDHTALPSRLEAEELFGMVSWKTSQRFEKDSQASKNRVHSVLFKGAGKTLDYYFLANNEADAELWIRLRKGSDQGVLQLWADNSKTNLVTFDGYSQSAVFEEVKIGTISGTQSQYKLLHVAHLIVKEKNCASSSFGATVDYLELRPVAPPNTNPCANQPDGSACNDGNACTQTDQCQAGSCVGSNPVVCTALDACHAAGVCDQTSGSCSNPNQPDNTACNDGNACTQTDRCQAGSCVGSNPVVCTALDACHAAGVCDQTSGSCSNPNQPEGTACNDNNLCTRQDTCVAGTCVGSNPLSCPSMPNCLIQGSCAPETGMCSEPSLCSECGNGNTEFNETCDDGNTVPGDGCSSTCQQEVCGDGIVQPTIQALRFHYLGRACNIGPTTITFSVRGTVVAQENLPESCDCQPGIRILNVTNPALLAAGVNGWNSFQIQTDGELAWALAVVYTRSMAMGLALWDYNDNNDVGNQNPDLCAAGAIFGFGTGMDIYLDGGETCDDGNTVDGDGCSSTCQTVP
jgi:cysteine-rich repeat protein